MSVEVGAWVWVPHEEDYVVPGKVTQYSGSNKTCLCVLEDGTEVSLSGAAVEGLQVLDPQCLNDDISNLIGLSNLSENAILHTLRIRFKADRIYTFVSSILIAVNPFRQLPLYGIEKLEYYRTTVDKSTLPPHIFITADNAYKAMMTDAANQSIVISGESGAGKTESTKLLLEYIAEVSGRSDSDESIQQQILQANPLMEAFGNAKTVRNNNSSRFGKLITIHFTNGSIRGASIISYLLEKTRVVTQQPEERNYHFFYQLMAAAASDAELAKQLLLTDEEYYYVSQSGVTSIEGVSDLEDFGEVQSAMETMGMTEEEQMNVFKVVAGILHIGNVEFKSQDTAGDVAAKVAEKDILNKISSVLGFNLMELERCLTSRNIGTRSVITCTYTPEQACDARDALSKKIYSKLFDWLILTINKSLAEKDFSRTSVFIAVLDIFGFEAFQHNSFEQLCINYCNEKLQFHFNDHIFKMEQNEYRSEGINVDAITYEDNQITLDLMEMKTTGIFSMIDEEIYVPRGSDEQLLSKIYQAYAKHPKLERAKKSHSKNAQNCFVIVHYAGEVAYDVIGFLEKNKDTLSEDLMGLVKTSEFAFLKGLFGSGSEETTEEENKPKGRRPASKKQTPSLGAQFKAQLTALMETLNSTQPHFVRCMKPNMEKIGRKYDSRVMLAQLRYAGLVEVCRIRQMGYPNRMSYEKFLRVYLVLSPGASSPANLVENLIRDGVIDKEHVVVGKSKIFLKHHAAAKLDSMRDLAYFSVARNIQRIVRGRIRRRQYINQKKTLDTLKKVVAERNRTLLKDAVAHAVDLPYEGVHLPVVKTAQALLRRFLEEDKVIVLLQEAIADREVTSLEGALRTAKGMDPPLDSPLVKQVTDLIDQVKQEKQHLKTAKDVLQGRNMYMLEDWIERAEELGLQSSDEMRTVQTLLERIKDETALLDDMRIAVAEQNLTSLSAYITKATEMGLDEHEEYKAAKKEQQRLEALHGGLLALQLAIETKQLSQLTHALQKAKTSGVEASEPLYARATLMADVIAKINACEEDLKHAIDAEHIEHLETAISKADGVQRCAVDACVEGVELHSLDAAQSLLRSLKKRLEATNALREALQAPLATRSHVLQQAVTLAKSVGLQDSPDVQNAVKELSQLGSQTKSAKSTLMDAAASDDLAFVVAAIEQAESSGIGECEEMTNARTTRDRLQHVDELISRLRQALGAQDMGTLRSTMSEVRGLGLGKGKYAELVKQADAKLKSMQLGMEVEMALAAAIRLKDVSALDAAIEKAQSGGITDSGTLTTARRLRDELSGQANIVDQIKAATAAKDITTLARLVEEAEKLNVSSRVLLDAKILIDRGAIVEETRRVLATATDLVTMTEAIERAIQLGLSDEELNAARARHTALSSDSEVSTALRSVLKNIAVVAVSENGISAADIAPLETALDSMQLSPESSASLLELEEQAKATLERCRKQLTVQSKLLAVAEDISMTELKKLLRISADLGLKFFKGYTHASSIYEKMLSDPRTRTQEEVDLDTDDLSNEKLEAMKEELYKEAKQPNYDYHNYVGLRTGEEFAKGIMLNKKKVIDGFLKHQKTPIGRSLTRLEGEDNRLAIVCHKSLLGYCGDKAVTFPASLALDIVTIGVKNPQLRNEIYLQAIKHTVANPSTYNQARAFHLICICADAFAPQPDFIYYLLNFLLHSAGDRSDTVNEPTPVEQMSAYALARIQALHHAGPNAQAMIVDVEAVEAYSARLPCLAKVYTPDETFLGELLVAPDVDVESLVMLLCQIMGIHAKRRHLIGMHVVTTKSGPLAPMQLMPDKDFYIGDLFQAPLLQKYGRPVKYYVKRKLLGEGTLERFVDPMFSEEEEDEVQMANLNHLTFTQYSQRYLEEQFRVTDHQKIAQLAAHQLATEAEFVPNRMDVALGQGCMNYIPESMRETQSEQYWGGLVAKALANCVGKDDDALKVEYVDMFSDVPLASMHTYLTIKGGACSKDKVGHIPDDLIFGVDRKGIHFINADSPNLDVVLSVPINEIRKIAIKTNSIKFTLVASGTPGRRLSDLELYDVELITPLNDEIGLMCQLYRPPKQEPAALTKRITESGPSEAAQQRMAKLLSLK